MIQQRAGTTRRLTLAYALPPGTLKDRVQLLRAFTARVSWQVSLPPFLALRPTNLLNCPIVDSHALPFILQLSSGPKNGELNKEVSNGGHCAPFGNDSYSGSGIPSCEMERVQKEVRVVRARRRRFLKALGFGGFVVVRQVRQDATAIPT